MPGVDNLLTRLREEYPVFRVNSTRVLQKSSGLIVEFDFMVGEKRFAPTIEIIGLTEAEASRADSATARRLVRALALLESFSYWKAFCSPVIEVAVSADACDDLEWWRAFWPHAMGEFFYRNGIDHTRPGFLTFRESDVTAEVGIALESTVAAQQPEAGPPLLMFSGGKDSLALGLLLDRHGLAPDHFLYNPTTSHARFSAERNRGRTLVVERRILPELLELNAAGHPNGHTPYSAYLAFAALFVGYLRGSSYVFAANSRSDDEPNVTAYHGAPVNHQWTKTYEFEHRVRDYEQSWLKDAPPYASLFRPLLELQIVSSLKADLNAYRQASSCNRTPGAWCRTCAKCGWVFLATAALFGLEEAVRKVGANVLADASMADVFERMAGLHGTKPFECTGTEAEVRATVKHLGQTLQPADRLALTGCLADSRIQHAPELTTVLAEWGEDDLLPPDLHPTVRTLASSER